MKTKINTAIALALALFAVAAVSQDKPNKPVTPEIVILQARSYYLYIDENSPPDTNGVRHTTYWWSGLQVFNLDQDVQPGTPQIWSPPTLLNPYEVSNDLTNHLSYVVKGYTQIGFRIAAQSGDGYTTTVTLQKP